MIRILHLQIVFFILGYVSLAALLVGRFRDRFPVVLRGIFSVVPPTEPCALRLTQPLKVSTRDFSWGKGGRCVWLTTYHACSAETPRKSGALTYPEPLGPPRPVAWHLCVSAVMIKNSEFVPKNLLKLVIILRINSCYFPFSSSTYFLQFPEHRELGKGCCFLWWWMRETV